MRKIVNEIYKVLIGFSFFGILLIPFPFYIFPYQNEITSFLFKDFVLFIIHRFDDLKVLNTDFSSDSLMLYFLLLVLLILALLIHFVLSFFPFWQKNQQKIFAILQIITVYYLALILLKYGFEKLLKIQFYQPEPNLLYTPLGQLDKDILYWSTIGSSYAYNVFLGLWEIIPSLLLLHKKTRVFGALLLFGVLGNVVMINLSYDISVKLFSTFLMLICLLTLIPSFKTFFKFFILNKIAKLRVITGTNIFTTKSKYLISKALMISLVAFETLMPLLKIGAINGDNLPKYEMHGAYELVKVISSEGIKSNFTNIKRVFFHKNYYLIFQLEDDSFIDYHVDIETDKLILTDYDNRKINLTYDYKKSTSEIHLVLNGNHLVFKALPWRTLPLLKPLFHWTVDDI